MWFKEYMNEVTTVQGHEGIWGGGGILPPIPNFTQRGGEWSSLHPGCCTQGKEHPGTH